MINLPYEQQYILKSQGLLFNTNGAYISPDNKIIYAGIPKNASSYVGSLLFANAWKIFLNNENTFITTSSKYNTINVQNLLVILRDPFERWVSGISQYLTSINISDINSVYNMIFDIVGFDDHTLPQYHFFNDIHSSLPRTYFMVNDKLSNTLKQHYSLSVSPPELSYKLPNDSTQHRKKLERNIIEYLNDKPHLITHIKEYYKIDYDIINSATFINYKP